MTRRDDYLKRMAEIGVVVEDGPDQELRYQAEPVLALRECQTRHIALEKRSRDELYELIPTSYAVGLRIAADHEAQKRFFKESYWSDKQRWKVRSRRDVFREVCKYLTNATTTGQLKLASKYAAVMWRLDEANVYPEEVRSILELEGLDAIARNGLPKPDVIDPRDVGDGMTARGEVIDYGDASEKAAHRDPLIYEAELDGISDYVRSATDPQGDVPFKVTYRRDEYGTEVRFVPADTTERTAVVQSAQVRGEDAPELSYNNGYIFISPSRRARIARTKPGEVTIVVVKPMRTGAIMSLKAVAARRLPEERARPALRAAWRLAFPKRGIRSRRKRSRRG